jgi:hypothetical protein
MNCFRERDDPQLVELTAILKSALQQSQQNHAKKDGNQGEAPKPIQLAHSSFVKQYEVIVLDRAFLGMFLILNNCGLGRVRETFTVISGRIEIADGCVDQGICLPLPVLYLLVALCHNVRRSVRRPGFSPLEPGTAYWQH